MSQNTSEREQSGESRQAEAAVDPGAVAANAPAPENGIAAATPEPVAAPAAAALFSEPAIAVDHAWLKFNIQFHRQDMTVRRFIITLSQRLLGGGDDRTAAMKQRRAASPDEGGGASTFWALKDIDLTVRHGEVVGLIGNNGAGKSTLLMMMAGIYAPDRGTVQTTGQIGTLLSLGAGFHNELTGRENILLNAVFLGLPNAGIAEKVEEIVEFSELGEFIDAPLRTYSSGMRARLGFSIAVTINPDVVLIDEVLEAGDAAFKSKSGNLIRRFKEKGKTIVLASHNMTNIRELCTRVLLLHQGKVILDGPAAEVVRYYKKGILPQPDAGKMIPAPPA